MQFCLAAAALSYNFLILFSWHNQTPSLEEILIKTSEASYKYFHQCKAELSLKIQVTPQCLKITQNVAFEFLYFGIFHQFLFY